MINHFYLSIKTPGQENNVLTFKVENELLKKLHKNGKKHKLSQGDLVSHMWNQKDWMEALCAIAITYLSNTSTYQTASDLFTDKPFVVCMELTKGNGFGHVQMCGSASLQEDTELEAAKKSQELFNISKEIYQIV
jgi:hypothetical protein